MIWQAFDGVRYENCAVFYTVDGEFGGFSNMANDFPLRVNGRRVGSTEALFQACRFPNHPEIQQAILDAPHAMRAKMAAKKDGRRHRFTRPDWNDVRVEVMGWCLAVKLAHHSRKFGDLLLSTGDRPIVERSSRDDFWAAKLTDEVLVGRNVLGILLMELREKVRESPTGELHVVQPPGVPKFRLLGEDIETVEGRTEAEVTAAAVSLASLCPWELAVGLLACPCFHAEEGNGFGRVDGPVREKHIGRLPPEPASCFQPSLLRSPSKKLDAA